MDVIAELDRIFNPRGIAIIGASNRPGNLGYFFLSGFVGGRPWAHLDIAGTARHEKGTTPHGPTGASGVGVRLLTEFVRNWDSG